MGSSVSDKSLSHLATSSYGDALTEVVEFGKQKRDLETCRNKWCCSS